MRKEFCRLVEKLALIDDKIIFLSGDLGYNAFENIQSSLGERFINCGVAEQSMIGIASGLAKKGFKVFCYSIAPFIVYRCLEQIRNDVCFHNLPVFIVGNGGGYGYGIMGSSHHTLSDIASVSSLPNITIWTPDSVNRIDFILDSILKNNSPAYLRLASDESENSNFNIQGSFNIINNCGSDTTVIALGFLMNRVVDVVNNEKIFDQINILSCIKFPISLSKELLLVFQKTKKILVIEDHVSVGGLSQQLLHELTLKNIKISSFINLCAEEYPSGLYGNQDFHLKESGLDKLNIKRIILNIMNTN